jgi:hypothetical protein
MSKTYTRGTLPEFRSLRQSPAALPVPNCRRPKGGGWKSARKGNSLAAYPTKASCG